MRATFLLMLSLLFLSPQLLAQGSKKRPAQGIKIDHRLLGIDSTIERILKEWHAPGCAIAVVEKNKVVYVKGYGYKDYEKKTPVTEHTLFAIGSCSKAFTASLMGLLQKDGKLDIDKPVYRYLPELEFYNTDLTNHVTVRDMMTHRTGLPRHDYSWYGSTAPRDSLLFRIRFLEPSAALREKWQYNNFMFLAQGVVAEKLYGKKWEDIVREKIFLPLEMKHSNFSVNDLQKAPDFTYGYKEVKDSVLKMDYMNIDPIGPAGSINSSASEMANWLKAWIQGGQYNGKEVIPASYVQQAIAGQMVVPGGLPGKDMPDVHGSEYGFGWFISSYRGHYLVQHGGNIDGFSANTGFYPTDSIGIVVLVNQNGSPVPSIIRNVISDRIFGLTSKNYSAIIKDAIAKSKSANISKGSTDSLNRKTGTKPSHSLSDYSGRYHHPGYGYITIKNLRDTLRVQYNSSKEKLFLDHYHYDIFNIRSIEDEENNSASKINFLTNNKGEIGSFETSLEPAVKDILFTRVPDEIKLTVSTLNKYVGEYELPGMLAKVYIRGENTLMLLVPGQPDYELVPVKEHEFDIKNLKGFSVKFSVDKEGRVEHASFIQPNGIFKAIRKK